MGDDFLESQVHDDDEDDDMMFQPEDACPCGSGIKYEDCCGLYD